MIFNFTPHAINVYNEDDVIFRSDLRKYIIKENVTPSRIFAPSGVLLNAKMESQNVGEYEGIPIVKSAAISVDPAPENGWVIVSRMYAAAAVSSGDSVVGRMLVVDRPVYKIQENNISPVGCLGFEVI